MSNEPTRRKSFLERATEIRSRGRNSLKEVVHSLQFNVIHFVMDRMVETGVTQSQLAAKMGMKESQVSRILHANGNFTIETIAKLFLAFNARPKIVEDRESVITIYDDTNPYMATRNIDCNNDYKTWEVANAAAN